jgi:hypothetical protein
MVLVGMCHVDNKWRLLLQNWWFDMQFVEVSAGRVLCQQCSGATIVWNFDFDGQTKIPDYVPILCSVHAETFMEDGGGDIREHIFDGN